MTFDRRAICFNGFSRPNNSFVFTGRESLCISRNARRESIALNGRNPQTKLILIACPFVLIHVLLSGELLKSPIELTNNDVTVRAIGNIV